MKKNLTILAKSGDNLITVPILVMGLQICMVTMKVWKASFTPTAPAKKHIGLPEYNREKQIAALYQYLCMEPPEKPHFILSKGVDEIKPYQKLIEAQNKIIEDMKQKEEQKQIKDRYKKPANEVLEDDVSVSSEESEPKPAKKSTKAKCTASKKEIEKGMYCVKCELCDTFAAYKEHLRPCCNCKRLTHINDELTNCWHYDCETCNKGCCYSCVKKAGSDRREPFCSPECKNVKKNTMFVGGHISSNIKLLRPPAF
jgi:hypothetical protein